METVKVIEKKKAIGPSKLLIKFINKKNCFCRKLMPMHSQNLKTM